MTIDSPVRPHGDQHTARLDQLRLRLDQLEAARGEIAEIAAQARRRLDAARGVRDDLARAAGGTMATFGETTAGESLEPTWLFSHPFFETTAVRMAADAVHVVRSEATPVHAAAARIDAAILSCRQRISQAEAALAAREQERARRLIAWTSATRERSLPTWEVKASEILARLELAGD
jgi:hypothetical protein